MINATYFHESCVDSKSTLPRLYWGLMDKPSTIREGRCAVCGKPCAPDAHHIVKRSAGNLIVCGKKMRKPLISLCGHGNASGCHGLAHAGMLHFRFNSQDVTYDARKYQAGRSQFCGHWEYLKTNEPTKYQDALEMPGWKRL